MFKVNKKDTGMTPMTSWDAFGDCCSLQKNQTARIDI